VLFRSGSLFVVFNSARLVRKGEELEHYHPEPVAPKPPRPAAPDLGQKPEVLAGAV